MRGKILCGVFALLLISPALAQQTPPPPPTAATVVDTSGITPPTPANVHTAGIEDYPLLSRALYEQGSVIVNFEVKEDGTVGDIHVQQSSGYQRLDDAAMAVVKQRWIYKPAMKDGKPIAVRTEARINWKLESPLQNPANSPYVVMQMDPADYPPESKANKEQGMVALLVLVAKDGTVTNTYVSKSSGFAKLDAAAIDIAMTRWKITPAQIAGKPVATVVAVLAVWSLPDQTPKD